MCSESKSEKSTDRKEYCESKEAPRAACTTAASVANNCELPLSVNNDADVKVTMSLWHCARKALSWPYLPAWFYRKLIYR